MDDEEFKKKLSEVAEWVIPKADTVTNSFPRKKRGRKSKEDQFQEENEEVFLEQFDGVNLTYPPMVTRVKRCGKNCEDCGKYCANGRDTEAKLHKKNGKGVWRKKCVTCGLYENPFTGTYELTGSAASIKWNDFMRGSKGVYNTKGNQRRKIVLSDKTVIENGHESITIYHEKNTD